MRYLSICSGIEAATVAWHPLGWTPAAFSEIEAFPRALLEHHYPAVPLHGDFTTIGASEYGPVDILVGGTPCQSFSVAGLRGGMADARGNLALEFLRLADRVRPRWVVWENVPGVLSSNGGRDFGSFLGALVELGYGFAYRVLDAQHFGVPQRRRRVFVVGHLGDWRRSAAVLFERHSLSGHPAPRQKKGEGVAGGVAGSLGSRGNRSHTELDGHGAYVPADVAGCLSVGGGGRAYPGTSAQDAGEGYLVHCPPIVPQAMSSKWSKGSSGPADDEVANLIAHSLRAEGFDASEDGTGRGTPLVPVAFNLRGREEGAQPEADPDNLAAMRASSGGSSRFYIAFNGRQDPVSGDIPGTLDSDPFTQCVAFQSNAGSQGGDVYEELSPTLRVQKAGGGGMPATTTGSAVRRLTPRECERLQGFPDDYTLIPYRGKPAADGPRYKALGNSMAVPVMRWIGERIDMVEAICAQARAA